MWTLNGIRIFVQEMPDATKQTIARLQPVNGGTVHQVFGYESRTFTLNAIAVGQTDADALRALAVSGSTYTLVTPWGSLTDLYVASVSLKPTMAISQTIRTDLDCDATVYNVEIQIYED